LLDDMSSHYDNIDAILIQGDSIVHGLSYPEMEHAWPMQKETLIFLRNAIAERFPYTPVLLTLGNNDVLEHYQPPAIETKAVYYEDLYAIWF
jgi:hypothetical protein